VSSAVATAVAKTGVLAALRVRAKVEGASVVVPVLVGLLVGQFALAPVVILLEKHAVVAPRVSAFRTPLRKKGGISAWPLRWCFLVSGRDMPRVSVGVSPPDLMSVLDKSTAA